MNKITSSLVGVSLSALALSGCAASSAAGDQPSRVASLESSSSDRMEAAVMPPEWSPEEHDQFWQENQAPLGDATALIEEQFPNEFAYAYFDDLSAMHVAFAGEAPAEAVALLEATGLPHFMIEEVGFNAAEYQEAADSVSEQLSEYVTEERQVSVSQNSELAPGGLKVSFLSEDASLTRDPGVAESVSVDAPFKVIFDFTNTEPMASSPVVD